MKIKNRSYEFLQRHPLRFQWQYAREEFVRNRSVKITRLLKIPPFTRAIIKTTHIQVFQALKNLYTRGMILRNISEMKLSFSVFCVRRIEFQEINYAGTKRLRMILKNKRPLKRMFFSVFKHDKK